MAQEDSVNFPYYLPPPPPANEGPLWLYQSKNLNINLVNKKV